MTSLRETIHQHRLIERVVMAFALMVLATMILFFGGYVYESLTTTALDPSYARSMGLLSTWWPAIALLGGVVYWKGGSHVS